jgi:hypothetical protein
LKNIGLLLFLMEEVQFEPETRLLKAHDSLQKNGACQRRRDMKKFRYGMPVYKLKVSPWLN